MKGGRRKIRGEGRKPKKFKNDSTTFEKKREILRFYNANSMKQTIETFYGPLSPTSRQYTSISRKIRRWNANKNVIEDMATKTTTSTLSRVPTKGTTRTTLDVETELGLVQWINTLRGRGVPVSPSMLRMQALRDARSTGIQEGFSASDTWIQWFLNRHKLSIRQKTRQGQVSQPQAEKVAAEFFSYVKDLMIQHKTDTVYNADQTAILYEYLPKSTVDKKGSKTVWVKCGGKEKERVTAMLLGDNRGNKFEPFVVLKTPPSRVAERRYENNRFRHGFGTKVWKEISAVQNETKMQIYGNKTGWWNAYLSIEFLTYFFGDRSENDKPILLVWDDLGAHWTDEVTQYAKSKNIILERVPPRYTFCCQPADIAWNKPLKDHLRVAWRLHLSLQVEKLRTNEGFKFAPPTRKMLLEWLYAGWQRLSKRTIQHGFKGINLLYDKCVDDNLVESMEALNLLDREFGEVSEEDDIVEVILEGN